MAQDIVELRTGQFSSVFLMLNSSSLTVIKRALVKKVKKSPSFFQNIAVILQFNPMLEKINLSELNSLLAEFNIHVIGVTDWQNALQKELILTAGLALLGKSDEISDILPEPRYLPTKVIEQNVEPNQVIYAKNSDLIIHGNVEKGAEVAADGNVHIYGKLRGRAMAGVNTNTGSIYAQHLDAEFVAVNSRFLNRDKIPLEFMQRAVRIFAEKEKLTFRILGEY
ncbi:septum site-determining protein MinC [[Pasteurella] aerogenes]|nr:septum site-determining protein MinC [[Pasteurella] aerogenes]MCI7718330.1 septum site-determining protein MinC [[Pasteurella] aerogenes]MCU9999080.1 septum site-determining protein MinC [[Pasteurella] aerogenes]MDY2797446.1 septum site-determining protein MinC [[Pasteurella] aerogenes]MDY4478431.1 septum site-determining protein MinC [[Pasteurella] aerogenes]